MLCCNWRLSFSRPPLDVSRGFSYGFPGLRHSPSLIDYCYLLEVALQAASTEAAALFFTITDMPMLRHGPVFELPGIAIEVAQECSGIRSSYVLFITTLAASCLFLRSARRRAMLIAFVIPLAIVRNALRIWVIGLLCVELGPQIIHSFIILVGDRFSSHFR